MTNFKDINPKLCHYCGTCIGICPTNCLSLGEHNESIVFDKSKCTNCSLCYENCPGIGFSFSKARTFFKNLGPNFDDLIGQYNSIFIGQTKDKEILKESSSGGIITSVLIYALKKKLIDGAILIVKNKKDPLGYKVVTAKSKKEVLERCQSLYRVVSLNCILKKIEKSNLKKLAYVGLPCHVEGIRKLQMNGNKVAKKIKLVLGIFCGLNKHFEVIEFFLSKLNVKKDDIVEFSFRKGNWPGNLYIKTENGREYWIDKDLYGFSYYMFSPQRCLLCYDFTNEFADISVGDGWSKLPSKEGWSDIIARSKLGKEVLLKMKKDNFLVLENSDIKNLINSHRGYIHFKKRGIFYRANKLKLYPNYGETKKATGFSHKLTFLLIKILRSKFVKKIFFALPIKFTGGLMLLLRKSIRMFLFKKK